jgi:hypothetical protein
MNARTVTAESRRGLNPAAAVVTMVTVASSAAGSAFEPCRGLCCRCRRHS